MYAAAGNHHGGGRPGVWCNSRQTNHDLLIHEDPARFFSPPYVGCKGWVGVWLDDKPDWNLVADILRDAYRLTAPKKLIKELDSVTPSSGDAT